MQRQHSSQATSTLGHTPNLYIGSCTGKTLYWFLHRQNTILVPRPKVSIVSSDREFCISPADGKSWLAYYLQTCFLRSSLLFTSKILQGDTSWRHCVSHLHPFPWCTSLRLKASKNITFPAQCRTGRLVFATPFGFMYFGYLWKHYNFNLPKHETCQTFLCVIGST